VGENTIRRWIPGYYTSRGEIRADTPGNSGLEALKLTPNGQILARKKRVRVATFFDG